VPMHRRELKKSRSSWEKQELCKNLSLCALPEC